MPQTLFQQKITYLFEQLNMKGKEKEFVAWFSKEVHSYSARKKVVIDKWLYGQMKENPKWKFHDFKIAKWKIDDIQVFPEVSFTDESLDIFKERVDSYVLEKFYLVPKKSEFEYKYIYYFNLNLKKIVFLELNIMREKKSNEYIIELVPSSFYKKKGIDKYIGTLIKNGNHYYISAKNKFEIVTFYFLENRGFESNEQIHGLSLELSYIHLLPTAKKRVLSKKKLLEEEKEELYLTLNETEYLISDESFYSVYKEDKQRYFNKFQEKIDQLDSFVHSSKKLSKEKIKGDAYLNIFYETFLSTAKIATSVKSNKRYWVTNKIRAYKTFLESIAHRDNSTCYIVTPIFNAYTYMFDEHIMTLIEHNIKCVKKGLKIEYIFVVAKEYTLSDFIQEMVKKLELNNIVVRFVLINDMDKLTIDSYDFLSSNHRDIVLYQDIHTHRYLYNVTKSKDKIKKLLFDYQKIHHISYPLEEFLIYQKGENNEILDGLVGEWYHYYYSSIKDNNSFKLWKEKLIIGTDKSIIYDVENKIVLEGEINTTFNKNQVFIYLTAKDSHDLSLISFEKQDIYKKIFKVSMLDKQISSHHHMASFGFFSKKKLEKSLVLKILGEYNHSVMLDNGGMDKRINDFYNGENF